MRDPEVLEILESAEDWGLRVEVEISAKKLIEQGYEEVAAFQEAYSEWVK